jgi:hypothetical protein
MDKLLEFYNRNVNVLDLGDGVTLGRESVRGMDFMTINKRPLMPAGVTETEAHETLALGDGVQVLGRQPMLFKNRIYRIKRNRTIMKCILSLGISMFDLGYIPYQI